MCVMEPDRGVCSSYVVMPGTTDYSMYLVKLVVRTKYVIMLIEVLSLCPPFTIDANQDVKEQKKDDRHGVRA